MLSYKYGVRARSGSCRLDAPTGRLAEPSVLHWRRTGCTGHERQHLLRGGPIAGQRAPAHGARAQGAADTQVAPARRAVRRGDRVHALARSAAAPQQRRAIRRDLDVEDLDLDLEDLAVEAPDTKAVIRRRAFATHLPCPLSVRPEAWYLRPEPRVRPIASALYRLG